MIAKTEFKRRRKALMELMEPNSIAIVPASQEVMRNSDVDFPFRQCSDFYYLSGFDEADAVLALLPKRKQGEFILFCRSRDRKHEQWEGERCGPERAPERYGCDDAFPIEDIDDILPGLIEGCHKVYYALGHKKFFDNRMMGWLKSLRERAGRTSSNIPSEFADLNHHLHDLRLFKSAAEKKLMRQSGKISAAAHCRAMRACKPGMYEYQLEAELLYEFQYAGARYPAYNCIVGSGTNACVLHYTDNNSKMQDGELVLIDAGCEYQFYASDITRTFPVNGKFSAEQKALYEIVLAAQEAAIACVQPGQDWNKMHEVTVEVIVDGLLELGILKGDRRRIIEEKRYQDFYMHRVGHWLGMDVHDVGAYRVDGHWRCLEPGMAFTIEPGIYIAPDNKKVAKKWRGIGIRIEDDVMVSKDGYDVLTADVPKTVADIEHLMNT